MLISAVIEMQETKKIKCASFHTVAIYLVKPNCCTSPFFDMGLTQEQITLFDLALKGRRTIPSNIIQTSNDMRHAEKNSVKRIFFEHGGVSVFGAYMFAQSMNRHCAQGRKKEFRLLVKSLNELSVEALQAAAVQLKGMMDKLYQINIERRINASRLCAIRESRLRTTPSNGA